MFFYLLAKRRNQFRSLSALNCKRACVIGFALHRNDRKSMIDTTPYSDGTQGYVSQLQLKHCAE